MSENDMITVRRQPDGTVVEVLADGSTRPYEGRTDWARLDATTEDEIEADALSDPDNPPLTPAELESMTNPPSPEGVPGPGRRPVGFCARAV